MARFLSLLTHKLRRRPEADVELLRDEVAALAATVRGRVRLLDRRIDGARGSVKPEVLAALAAYDETLPPDWRGVATEAGLLASLADIDRALRAEMAAELAPSDDEEVRRRQREVQQIVALFEGQAQPDPTHPIEEWHRKAADLLDDAVVEAARERRAAERVETDTPPTAGEIQRMVHHSSAVVQVANLVEGRPNPAGTPGPGHRHRAIARAIRDIFERHGGPVKTPLVAPFDAPEPGTQPQPVARPARDPDIRKIPRLVRAHVPDRPMATDDRDALVRAVKTALVFGRPYMKRRVVEAVGARCAARGLAPDQIKRAQEAAGLVTAGFNTRSLADTAASLDARGATPYQKAVGLTSDVIVTMAKLHGARRGPGFPEEMARKVADLADDPAYYLELYVLVAAVDGAAVPPWVALSPGETGWRADAVSIIRDVVRAGGR